MGPYQNRKLPTDSAEEANYPGEFRGHLLHNGRLAMLFVPATILVLEHPLPMLLIPLAFCVCLANRRERRLTLLYAGPAAAIVALPLAWGHVPAQSTRHPMLMAVIVLAYTAYLGYVIVRDGEGWWRDLVRGHRTLVLLWASLPLLILPLIFVFRVMPRHLTPLIPAGIFWAAYLGETAWLKTLTVRRQQRDYSTNCLSA